MFDKGLSKGFLGRLRDAYPRGLRVVCDSMEDPRPVPSGTVGTVLCVDDIGQIHVSWDNGSTLALLPGTDRYHVVGEV